MELVLGKSYVDRAGKVWLITSVSNGQREDIGPVTGARWEHGRYLTRIFRRDGTYSVDGCSNWDLIALA